MRAILAVFALLILSGAAYWALQSDGPAIAPPSNSPDGTKELRHANADPAQAERDQVLAPPKPELTPPPSNDTQTQQNEAVAPAPQATVVLTVRDVVTRQPIETFRWRFVQPRALARGESTSSVAELVLPRRAIGDLMVEADGMQPFTKKQLVLPAENEPTLLVDVFLTPSATAAGIKLIVKRLDNQPVAHVRVDAFEINAGTRDTAWQLGQPLWARRTAAEDGIY